VRSRPVPAPLPEVRHRALAHHRRVELLDLLRARDGASDAGELADEVGLHINTVRSHLQLLEDAGLVTSETEVRTVRGRPRLLFRATPEPRPVPDSDYRGLAAILAGTVAQDPATAADVAVDAGVRWGRQLATTRPAPRDVTVTELAVGLLDELGFAPRPVAGDPAVIDLTRCPYLAVAEAHPEVVCGVHLGVLRGALAAAGVQGADVSLVPFATPTTCRVSLAG
jgi:predicted ArsR family transcriptional regulator